MNRVLVIGFVAAVVSACNSQREIGPCSECVAGTGAVNISVELTSADVIRVVASVSGPGISVPITKDLSIGGMPRTASGTILAVPAGAGRVVWVGAYPAGPTDPEGAVVIYRGQTTVAVVGGQITPASLTLNPVLGDVAVSASFPAGDSDLPRVHHVTVVVSGNRIDTPATFYLQFNLSAGTGSGTALKIPVGLTRTVTVKSFAADGTLLHQGTAATEVAEQGTSVSVTMANATGTGGVSIDAGFCNPSCGTNLCGDDGCGGSCGGCMPGSTCSAGSCSVLPVSGLAEITTLSTIPTSGEGCWFTNATHAVAKGPDGSTVIATGEHRYCDTKIDRAVVYTRATDGTWSNEVPFTYDYSNAPASFSWGRGLTDGASAANVGSGVQAVIGNQPGTNDCGAKEIVDLQMVSGHWTATQTGVSDAPIQAAEGNSAGGQYSGFEMDLAYAPGLNRLHVIGSDGAWFAVKYHAILTTATPGLPSSWSAASAVYTNIGATDRASVKGAAQDFSGSLGVQVWIDGPTCTLMGRELSGGNWGSTSISVPLQYSSCSGTAPDYYGFQGRLQVFFSGGEPTVILLAHPNASSTTLDVLRYSRSNGNWAQSSVSVPASFPGGLLGRAFTDDAGGYFVLHKDVTGAKIRVFDLQTSTGVELYAAPSPIWQLDVEQHSPTAIVWSERGTSVETLKAALLVH